MVTLRRKFTEKDKRTILEKAERLGVNSALDEHHISIDVLARWKKQLLKSKSEDKVEVRLKHLIKENKRLRKIIADLILELEWRE